MDKDKQETLLPTKTALSEDTDIGKKKRKPPCGLLPSGILFLLLTGIGTLCFFGSQGSFLVKLTVELLVTSG